MIHNVILVDDEPIIKQSLQKMVNQTPNFHVAGIAENGEEALRLTNECSPDLIITDIRMPIMDGIELMRAAKQYDESVEIILLTGYAEFEFARQAIRLGAIDYLLKPIEPELLAVALDKAHAKLNTVHLSPTEVNNEWIWKCKEIGNHLTEMIWKDERELEEELDVLHDLLLSQGKNWGPLSLLYRQLAVYIEKEMHTRSNKLIHTTIPALPASNTENGQKEPLRQWFRLFVFHLSRKVRNSRNWNAHLTVKKAIEHIESHFDDDMLSLSSTADRLGISASYLSRCFSEEQGISFIQYVQKYRMEKAMKYLRNPERKTYEIASKVGFSDYPHFARTFKKHFGFSASAYRKKHQWDNP